MSSPLPSLRGTSAQVLYPYTRTPTFKTDVTIFANGSEQRISENQFGPLQMFQLPMSKLLFADQFGSSGWLPFFITQKGRFNTILSLTAHGVTYNNMTLEMDNLDVHNKEAQLYDQEIKLRQVSNSWSLPSVPTSFPTLSFGASCEYEFVQSTEFLTMVSDNEFGPQYGTAYYGAGLTDYPSTPLKKWKLEYPLVDDADIATLETFFLGVQGRYCSFSFTDPISGTTYSHVRLNQDEMAITGITKNQWKTSLTLRQTYNS